MKVGDMVEFRGFCGLILKIGENERENKVFVGWLGLEPEWESAHLLEVIG